MNNTYYEEVIVLNFKSFSPNKKFFLMIFLKLHTIVKSMHSLLRSEYKIQTSLLINLHYNIIILSEQFNLKQYNYNISVQ